MLIGGFHHRKCVPIAGIKKKNFRSQNGQYLGGCKAAGVKRHPARFPAKLPEFFIRFLTEPGDLVVDIFAGSNTTGRVAEDEGRRWLAYDQRRDYLAASSFRFLEKDAKPDDMAALYERIMAGESVNLLEHVRKGTLSRRDPATITHIGHPPCNCGMSMGIRADHESRCQAAYIQRNE